MAGKSTATVTGVPVLFFRYAAPSVRRFVCLCSGFLGQMTVVLTEMFVPQPLPSALARGQTEGRRGRPRRLFWRLACDKLGRRGQATVGVAPALKLLGQGVSPGTIGRLSLRRDHAVASQLIEMRADLLGRPGTQAAPPAPRLPRSASHPVVVADASGPSAGIARNRRCGGARTRPVGESAANGHCPSRRPRAG